MSRYRMSTKICLRYTSSESSAVMKSRNHEKIILHSPGWGLTFSLISFQLKMKLNNLSPKNKREISFMFPLYHSTLTTPLIPVLAHQTSNYLKVKHFPLKKLVEKIQGTRGKSCSFLRSPSLGDSLAAGLSPEVPTSLHVIHHSTANIIVEATDPPSGDDGCDICDENNILRHI